MTPIRMRAALAAMALILCTSADQTMFGASTKDGEPIYTFVTLAVLGCHQYGCVGHQQ